MTEVDLPAVYRVAEKVRTVGADGGAWLTGALNAIGPDSVASAFGGDEMGRQMADGFSQMAGNLTGAGTTLEENLIVLGDGVSGGANLVRQVDGHNADAIKATDLRLQPDGNPLPPDSTGPSR
jgi:hypothetical protein